MITEDIKSGRYEKAAAGWWGGCNSNKSPWLLKDSQYIFGENVACRGGIVQTRPSYKLRMSMPSGLPQGGEAIYINKTGVNRRHEVVFAIGGYVYAVPIDKTYPYNHVSDWSEYKLDIQFSSTAKTIYFEVARKSSSIAEDNTIKIQTTYNVLMMQDGGESEAAYYDGELSGHLSEASLQTPKGSWMKWSGERLWVAKDNILLSGDITDPLSFRERIDSGSSSGDVKFDSEITGIAKALGDNRQTNLVVFTHDDGSLVLSSILDRSKWASTANFKSTIFPSVGCDSGLSIVNHAGLLWWHSHGGVVNSDSAAAAYLTSEIKYKDVEMSRTKRNINPDTSGICSFSFENYLGFSVPYGDEYNSNTMVIDSSISNELNSSDEPPAWQGVWTGIRPVKWIPMTISGVKRLFCISMDYQALNGETTFNHLWEAFQPEREDIYFEKGLSNEIIQKVSRIYCSTAFKPLGDGLDIKRFAYADAELCEIGGHVDLKVSFSGKIGSYTEIARRKYIATRGPQDSINPDVQRIYDAVGPFMLQRRRMRTNEYNAGDDCNRVELNAMPNYDSSFSLLFQWCGRMGIEMIRVIADAVQESPVGSCEEDETVDRVLTQSGTAFLLKKTSEAPSGTTPSTTEYSNTSAYLSPVSPRYADVFYSSIPVKWEDLDSQKVTDLPCCRDRFTPPTSQPITVDGKIVK